MITVLIFFIYCNIRMSDYIFDYYLYGFTGNFNSQFWTTSWLYYVYDPGSEKSLVTIKPTLMYSDDLY